MNKFSKTTFVAALVPLSFPLTAQAADNWGALAYSHGKNKYGSAWNQSSESGAKQTAMAQCKSAGGSRCKIELVLKNSCGAYAVAVSKRSTKRSGYSYGFNDHGPAKSRALQECSKATGGDECFVVRSVCSIGK